MPLIDLFAVQVSPWELIIRGTAIYWFLFLIFRLVLRRDGGAVGIADVLLVVLIADASQNGMAGEYRTISEGMILIATIVGWNWVLDWACYRYPRLDRLINPRPVVLIRHGRIVRENLAKEWLTVDELRGKLREQGIENPAQVKVARMESEGEISVIRYSPAEQAAGDRKTRRERTPR